MMSCKGCKNRNTWICAGCVGWNNYEGINQAFSPKVDITKEMKMLGDRMLKNVLGDKKERKTDMRIKKVYFNEPATVVLWEDGTKTIVKSGDGDIYDPEKGLAMAIAKKALGNQGNYYEVFKKWLPEERKVIMLTAEELAEKLGCTKATIQKQCRQGQHPGAVKVGGKWKIPY